MWVSLIQQLGARRGGARVAFTSIDFPAEIDVIGNFRTRSRSAAATVAGEGRRGYSFVAQCLDDSGKLVLDDLSRSLGLSKGQLAETVGIRAATLHRKRRALAPKTQSRFREMLEIVGRVADWAGGEQRALAWYRAGPIAEFGGRTAEALVKEGKAAAIREYLDHVALGARAADSIRSAGTRYI
jgi:uncharacterized protein (DUF2384 family)